MGAIHPWIVEDSPCLYARGQQPDPGLGHGREVARGVRDSVCLHTVVGDKQGTRAPVQATGARLVPQQLGYKGGKLIGALHRQVPKGEIGQQIVQGRSAVELSEAGLAGGLAQPEIDHGHVGWDQVWCRRSAVAMRIDGAVADENGSCRRLRPGGGGVAAHSGSWDERRMVAIVWCSVQRQNRTRAGLV